MKRARLKNLPASVHQRLLNLSREKGEEPNQVFLRHEEVYNLARNVRKSSTLESSPHFRNFIAVALEALGKKLLVIKRIGTNYIPEVGSIQRDLTEVVVDFFCVASYYREDPKIAEKLSEQFFYQKKWHIWHSINSLKVP